MGEIKELEEANRELDKRLSWVKTEVGTPKGNQLSFLSPHQIKQIKDIVFNLKGDGWRIAIIEDSETVWVLQDDGDPDSKRVPFKHVIWQVGE